jgi:hypothetical protein
MRFITDYWMNFGGFHRIIKGNGAEQIAEVCYRTGFHFQFLEPFGKRFELDCTLQKAIIGMHVQMYEIF